MNKLVLIHITFFVFCFSGLSQSNTCVFSGTIEDTKGNPIPYSSIYIPKLATGKMANMDGYYQMSLPCGIYKIKVQCLGYETKFITINASANNKQTIVLSPKSFSIREVTVNASDEDPAYNVMRKAVVMAKYYRKQIQEYSCNVYMRRYYLVDNIPKIAKLFAEKEDIQKAEAGDLSETLLTFNYKRPNKVRQKIISTRNARGDTSKILPQYINLSFYDLGGTSIISPLSKHAFSVYKFELINTYLEDGKTINKIKIIPKRKGHDLMRGYIYINEDTWNINSVNVKFKQQFVDIQYKQIYSEISDNAWMPINHEIWVKAKAMGFKGHFKYIASLSNIKLKTDPLIDDKIKSIVSLPVTDEFENANTPADVINPPKKSKTEEKIQRLMDQDKLTKGETMKLVRLVQKQAVEEEKKQKEKPSLDITGDHKIEYADSAFKKSDSLWSAIREVPLSQEEKMVYKSRDSLACVESGDTIANKKRSFMGNLLFFNGTIKSKNKNSRLKIPGLLAQVSLNFNTVDGFLIRKTLFSYKRKYDNGRYFKVEPLLQYATAREDLMGKIDFMAQYNMEKRARFYFSAGKINQDFNTMEPMPNFFNSVATLLFSENYKKLYQKKYLELGHSFDLSNGLNLNTSVEYADRSRLYNHSDFKIIRYRNKDYSSNTPGILDTNNTALIFDDNRAMNISATISYTPKQYFRYVNNEKRMLRSKYPTFSISYKHGVKNAIESQSDFSFIEGSVRQSKKINLIDRVSYYIGGGKFITNNSLYFADYKNFNTQPFYFIGGSDVHSFRLLNFYTYNTLDYFVEGHFSIEDNFLLLKNLPLLNTSFMSEGLYANYLFTDQQDHYYEFGYGLKNVFLLFDVEGFVSFKNENYNAFGVKLRLNFIGNQDSFN